MNKNNCIILLGLFLAACTGSEDIQKFPTVENKYDPSQPKEVTKIMPITGRIDDNFVIEGNLGTNVAEMKVYFGEKKALLLKTDGHTLHGIVPKQPDGFNKITVVLDNDSIITDFDFRYRQNQVVTTIAGSYENRVDWDNGKPWIDGSLTEGTFQFIRGLTLVAGGKSILVAEERGNLRLVSLEDEKITKLTGEWQYVFGDGAVNKAQDEAYFIHWDTKAFYRCKRSEGWLPVRIRLEVSEIKGKCQKITFGSDDRYVYLRDHNGLFGRLDLADEKIPFELLLTTQPDGSERAKLCYCKVSDCFYYNMTNSHGIYKIWQDKQTGEWKEERYAGFNGGGTTSGHKLNEAQFNQPVGLCTDNDGNLYVTNIGSQIIQKVWLKSGFVEHVAGCVNVKTPKNGKPLESAFSDPYSIAMDSDENFIIAGSSEGQIRKYAIE